MSSIFCGLLISTPGAMYILTGSNAIGRANISGYRITVLSLFTPSIDNQRLMPLYECDYPVSIFGPCERAGPGIAT